MTLLLLIIIFIIFSLLCYYLINSWNESEAFDKIKSLGIIGTIISILLGFILTSNQLETNNMTLKFSNHLAAVSQLNEINKIVINNSELFKSLKNDTGPEDEIEFYLDSRTRLCEMVLSMLELVYYQYNKYGLLDEEIWNGWEKSMKQDAKILFNIPYFKRFYNNYKIGYSEKFTTFMENKNKSPD